MATTPRVTVPLPRPSTHGSQGHKPGSSDTPPSTFFHRALSDTVPCKSSLGLCTRLAPPHPLVYTASSPYLVFLPLTLTLALSRALFSLAPITPMYNYEIFPSDVFMYLLSSSEIAGRISPSTQALVSYLRFYCGEQTP